MTPPPLLDALLNKVSTQSVPPWRGQWSAQPQWARVFLGLTVLDFFFQSFSISFDCGGLRSIFRRWPFCSTPTAVLLAKRRRVTNFYNVKSESICPFASAVHGWRVRDTNWSFPFFLTRMARLSSCLLFSSHNSPRVEFLRLSNLAIAVVLLVRWLLVWVFWNDTTFARYTPLVLSICLNIFFSVFIVMCAVGIIPLECLFW